MPNSGLRGPFSLTSAGIDSEVTRTSAGAYALGKTDDQNVFHIHYVGRADSDVATRLKAHVPKWYPQFKFEYYPSAKAAFEKECNLFHDFGPGDNEVHPARPQGASWTCPRCTALD
jgi:hypothetical protein